MEGKGYICDKFFDAYGDMVRDGLRRRTFDADYFCEITFNACENTHFKPMGIKNYTDRVLADKPDIIKNNDFIDRLYRPMEQDLAAGYKRETMTIYHITDLHWDLEYQAGTSDV